MKIDSPSFLVYLPSLLTRMNCDGSTHAEKFVYLIEFAICFFFVLKTVSDLQKFLSILDYSESCLIQFRSKG